jgi:hypothetical protein
VKLGKVSGFDGIFPEVILNCGDRTEEDDFLSSAMFPKTFKRAKVVTFLTPGKDGSDPAHYRPVSLLSVVYKLLERLLLQRIHP